MKIKLTTPNQLAIDIVLLAEEMAESDWLYNQASFGQNPELGGCVVGYFLHREKIDYKDSYVPSWIPLMFDSSDESGILSKWAWKHWVLRMFKQFQSDGLTAVYEKFVWNYSYEWAVQNPTELDARFRAAILKAEEKAKSRK